MEPNPDAVARLRTIIAADAVLSTGAGLFTISMYFLVARVRPLFWVGLFVVLIGGFIATSLRPLARGDVHGATLRLSLANWCVALGSTFVATFQWPLQMQVALLPIVLAATFVSRDRLNVFVVVSLITAAAVAALGLLQDVTGLSANTPTWLQSAVLLLTAPPFAALVVLVTVQHNRRLELALDSAQSARLQLQEHAEELRRSRLRVVSATDRERRRIERDLHDGAQSRLVAVNLKLAEASGLVASDPDAALRSLADARKHVHRAHGELRDLAHGIYPSVLTQHGLVSAITAAADHSPAPIRLDLHPVGRLPDDIETAIYFCVIEAVQNAAKHAQASRVDIQLERSDEVVHFSVTDDGVGFSPAAIPGVGLANLADRCRAIGGDVEISSDSGRGTSVRGWIDLGNS